jgi:hypothetical protein
MITDELKKQIETTIAKLETVVVEREQICNERHKIIADLVPRYCAVHDLMWVIRDRCSKLPVQKFEEITNFFKEVEWTTYEAFKVTSPLSIYEFWRNATRFRTGSFDWYKSDIDQFKKAVREVTNLITKWENRLPEIIKNIQAEIEQCTEKFRKETQEHHVDHPIAPIVASVTKTSSKKSKPLAISTAPAIAPMEKPI